MTEEKFAYWCWTKTVAPVRVVSESRENAIHEFCRYRRLGYGDIVYVTADKDVSSATVSIAYG